ncbi:FAU ubiquitin-like and ribosomal protein S30 [Leptopilina boulardi]|uniref:FAU ubiquitin-like and ribosomal protein S30 n=1 Tax=Leptopilina boulardi TaxID=63433 RepID=UPI0021F5CAE3|nr:FAU ubiquitin-like and ribosomal protein S30 [Leptopilina boulardi]XP_051164157.1 FAU ubiquitin-like and ribosomal protein S30 [Leptopilina boulardi]
MQLYVRGQETRVFECQDDETVAQIKARILAFTNLESGSISLCCGGATLADDVIVGDLQFDTLDFNVVLLGGKVHGSLARAGKVKGQTPKVEKQEKSKKKTGRAKRRIQYNRRFVNVVQTYGRRRGPNANPNS